MTKTNRTAEYKGRIYRLLYLGKTRFGERAKLGFFDGSTEFWVGASLVKEVKSQPSRRSSGRCRDCGQTITDAPHHRAMGGLCGNCAFDEYDM